MLAYDTLYSLPNFHLNARKGQNGFALRFFAQVSLSILKFFLSPRGNLRQKSLPPSPRLPSTAAENIFSKGTVGGGGYCGATTTCRLQLRIIFFNYLYLNYFQRRNDAE